MNVLDTAKDQILGVVGKLVDGAPHGEARQTVTVAGSVVDAEEFWRDAHRLSVVLGDLGEVTFTEPNRYRWRLHTPAGELTWNSRLVSDNDGLRFVGDNGNEVDVRYRPAPRGLGTEVTLHVRAPVPGLLSGTAAFTVLYRMRALLQTGEVPTIAHNPSARPSAR